MNNVKSSWPLIGLIIISTAAFFGFGKVFSISDSNIGTQAITAAFGALFIILSTKFLMGQEAEAQRDLMLRQEKIQREYDKERKIFEDRVKVFSDAAKLVSEVLADNAIGKDELSRLRGMALELHLSANKNALESFTAFLGKCVDIYGLGANEDDDSEIVSLEPEEQRECWKLAAEFIISCREGLSLPGEDASTDVLVGFTDMLEKVDEAVHKTRRRTYFVGDTPLEEYIEQFNGSNPNSLSPGEASLNSIRTIQEYLDDVYSKRDGVDFDTSKTSGFAGFALGKKRNAKFCYLRFENWKGPCDNQENTVVTTLYLLKHADSVPNVPFYEELVTAQSPFGYEFYMLYITKSSQFNDQIKELIELSFRARNGDKIVAERRSRKDLRELYKKDLRKHCKETE